MKNIKNKWLSFTGLITDVRKNVTNGSPSLGKNFLTRWLQQVAQQEVFFYFLSNDINNNDLTVFGVNIFQIILLNLQHWPEKACQ